MPYGVKQGVRAPGEWGIGDIMGLGLAGAAGTIAALVTDYQQSGEASALFTINQWVSQAGAMLGFTDIPLWTVLVGMMLVSAGSIFYFQPITRQGAFAQGFGLLAVMMTATPADLAGGLESYTDVLPALEPASTREASLEPAIIPAAYVPGGAAVYQIQDSREAAKYNLQLTIVFPNDLPGDLQTLIRRDDIRGRLYNADTGSTYNLFRAAGGTIQREGNTLHVRAGVPARSDTATLWVRIECPDYAIEEQSTTARLGEAVDWTVQMQPSNTPLFIQRLNKSYWF